MNKPKTKQSSKYPTIKPEDPWVEVEMNKMKKELKRTNNLLKKL